MKLFQGRGKKNRKKNDLGWNGRVKEEGKKNGCRQTVTRKSQPTRESNWGTSASANVLVNN